jgi:hypothetical protein
MPMIEGMFESRRCPVHQRSTLAAIAAGVTLLVAACGSERAAVSTVPSAAGSGSVPTATVAGAATTAPVTTEYTGASLPGTAAPEAAKLLAAATSKTTAAKTVSLAVGIHIDAVGMPGGPSSPISMAGQGSFDYDAKTGSLHLDLSGLGAGTGAPPAIDLVVSGDTGYVKLPDSLVASTGGKHWTKLEGSSGSNGLSIDLSQLKELTDPSSFLKFVEAVSADGITKVGTDVLHGEPATHYQVQIDPTKLAPSSGGAGTGLGGDLGGMAQMLGSSLPADIWVDAEGRVRQFELSIDLTQFMKAFIDGMSGLDRSSSYPSSSDSSSTASSLPADFKLAYTTKLEMWDFGKPVTITLPDPSDVADGVSIPGFGDSTGGLGDTSPDTTGDSTADTMVPTDATPVTYPSDTTVASG